MNINKLQTIVLAFCMAFLTEAAFGQDLADVLKSVEENNTELIALRKQSESEKYSFQAERALESPEIGFGYLWGPKDVGTRKDISISQSFDIAALSGTRKKISESKTRLEDLSYSLNRQRVLLETEQICIRLIWCNAMASELSSRLDRSSELEKLSREMFEKGEIDAVEMNNARIAYLAQKNALSRNEIERQSLMTDLQRLNGGEAISFDQKSFEGLPVLPKDFEAWYAEAARKSPELKFARQNVEVNAAVAQSVRMSNWPSFTAGYMAELVKDSNFHGVTFGISIPLWSVRSKSMQARSSVNAAKLEERDVNCQAYLRLKGLYDKTHSLEVISSELDESLAMAKESIALINTKFKDGEISILNEIMDWSLYYSVVDESLQADRDYHLALAELNSWDL